PGDNDAVAELRHVTHRLHGPAEYLPVEIKDRVIRARVQLEPRGYARLVQDSCAEMRSRLPDADGRAARIDDLRHDAEVGHRHRLNGHLGTVRDRALDRLLRVGRSQMDAPTIGRVDARLPAHAARAPDAVLPE